MAVYRPQDTDYLMLGTPDNLVELTVPVKSIDHCEAVCVEFDKVKLSPCCNVASINSPLKHSLER